MKKLFCILFIMVIILGGLNSTVIAQNDQQKFFHDLQGLEDSSGKTHLFYRLFSGYLEDYTDRTWENNVYHFNTANLSDTLKFKSYDHGVALFSGYVFSATQDYLFIDENLEKWFTIKNSLDQYSNLYGYVRGHNNTFFHTGWNLINKFEIVHSDSISMGIYDFQQSSIVNIITQDSLPSETYAYPMAVKAVDDDELGYYCPNGEGERCFYGKSDSVLIYNYNFLSVDGHQQGGLYFQRNDSLFWSDDLGETMNLRNDTFPWSSMDSFLFGEDNSTIIAATRFKFSPLEIVPDTADYYQLLKSTNSGNDWQEVFGDSSEIYLSQKLEKEGLFYFGNKNKVYESTNYGDSFSEVFTVDHSITGLYKKPDSDILYVLTREELLEVNTETKETISLKKLPVSNESEPSEIPNQITLEQNYPNPFNPSTVISYQLNSNQLVRLEVFDVTGRKVAVLVDGERKSAGQHRVSFDGSGLSSGVYFYRLEAGGQTLTQKMLLVK